MWHVAGCLGGARAAPEQAVQALQAADAVVAEVQLFKRGARAQAGHARQPVALQRQLPQRRQPLQAGDAVNSVAAQPELRARIPGGRQPQSTLHAQGAGSVPEQL